MSAIVWVTDRRLQAPTDIAVGHQHAQRTALAMLLHIWRADGFRGLFRGVSAAMPRVGVGSAVQLSTYDTSKRTVLRVTGLHEGVPVHFLAAMTSGLAVSAAMNPFDVGTEANPSVFTFF